MSTGLFQHGFTLLEALVTTIVLGVIAGVTLPLISSATDVYAASANASSVVDKLTFSLDRVVTILREAPVGDAAGTIGVDSASSIMVRFSDGTGCRLEGGALLVQNSDGSEGTVASGIDSFELRFVAADGSDAMGIPSTTQRFEIEISSSGLVLRTVAFCRSRYGS
jgi:prepilin-type N-terminal cleavage/methylation domain-containing protein